MKFNIITLWQHNDWGLYNRRNEALLRELAQRDEVESVLHVEPVRLRSFLTLLSRSFRSKDKHIRQVYRQHVQKALSYKPMLVNAKDNISVYSLFILYPHQQQKGLYNLSQFLLQKQMAFINQTWVKNKQNIILIAYPPAFYLPQAVSTIRHDLLIADIMDDVLTRVQNQDIKEQYVKIYQTILPKCAWLFSTSPEIDRNYRQYAKQKIEFIPNGIDIDNHTRIESKPTTNNNSLTVGYVGSFNDEMDTELLEHVVSQMPDVAFKFIGFTTGTQSKIFVNMMRQKYTNFHFLGRRHYSEVPRYISGFTVLSSFKKHDYTTSGGESIKIYEYLATGKPIVTTPVPPADRFLDVMYVTADKHQFVTYLHQALAENNKSLSLRRKQIAAENSWSKRVDIILEKVKALP